MLNIKIVGTADEMIGFRINAQKIKGEIKNNLLPTEGRKTVTIEMSLCRAGEIVYGPYLLCASSDYDYVDGDSLEDLTFTNTAGEQVTVLPFSLGQLEPFEAAQEATLRPLYVKLAQKVVDAISSDW